MKNQNQYLNSKNLIPIFLITLFIIQVWYFITYQMRINSRLDSINIYDAKIIDIYNNNGNSFLINYYQLKINDLKLAIMPLERVLGYIEISFIIYPIILSNWISSRFKKKDIDCQVETPSKFQRILSKIDKQIVLYLLRSFAVLLVLSFVTVSIIFRYFSVGSVITARVEIIDNPSDNYITIDIGSSPIDYSSLVVARLNNEIIDSSKIDVFGFVNYSEVGEYIIEYYYEGSTYSSLSTNIYTLIVSVEDTVSPVIDLSNFGPLVVDLGDESDFFGIIISDNSNEYITPVIEHNIDFNTAGTYELKITASDSSNNITTLTIQITVK